MWILALETATAAGSLALLEDGEVRVLRSLDSRQYGSVVLLALEAALAEAGIALPAVDAYAVADGPGSFTGVRIGLSVVKGLMEATGKPAVPISALRAVAEAAGTAEPNVLAALDASRGEIYFGLYPEGAAGAEEQEGLESAAAFELRLRDHKGLALSPHAALVERFPALRLTNALLAPAVGRLGACRLTAGLQQDALRLDARYLRRSDAEIFTPTQWP